MPHKKEPVFGIAMRNFTKYPEMPSAAELIDYGVGMEALGYESIWAWDQIPCLAAWSRRRSGSASQRGKLPVTSLAIERPDPKRMASLFSR